MDLASDQFKSFKRMRLNNGDMVGMQYSAGFAPADDCKLELGFRQALCTPGLYDEASLVCTSTVDHDISFGRTKCPADFCTSGVDDNISHGRADHVSFMTRHTSDAVPGRHQILHAGNQTYSLDPPAHLESNLDLTMSLPDKAFSAGSWYSTKSLGIGTSPSVDLGLGLKVISGADSALTSVQPSSTYHVDVKDLVSSWPFPYQDGSSQAIFNEDIPMVDEGSTSNGKYILPFLHSNQPVRILPFSVQRVGVTTEHLTETDVSPSFKASSGTTSTTGTSSGGGDHRAPKMCKFQGCTKRARGASGLCISHGGGRRCQRPGCNKGAEGSTIFCKAHGGGRRCERLGCTKSAEGKTEFCIAHGGGARCLYEGCPKAARGRTGFCIRHGGGKRCQKEGCTKSAEGYTALCIAHGGGKRCQFPNCGKGAQGSTMFCKAHGGGKRCIVEGCNKGAEGSTPLCKGHGGGKRCMFEGGGVCTKSVHGGTQFCVAHGGGKRCAVQGCTKSARGRTDCCVKHGGGKRCKFENCSKSAQGSTDFCKAHGGGKRCVWGQEGSLYSGVTSSKGSCDRYAKGKLGLCAAHSALVQDRRVHGLDAFGSSLSMGIQTSSLHECMGVPLLHEEKNLLSGFDASEDGTESSALEGAESPVRVSMGSGGLQEQQDHMEDDTCYHPALPCLFPSMLAVGTHHGPTAGGFVDVGVRTDVVSTPSSMLEPAFTSHMFGSPSIHRGLFGKREDCGRRGSANTDDDGIFNMSSLSLPEERVHGGNILALLSGES